jgi:hypothetical protein
LAELPPRMDEVAAIFSPPPPAAISGISIRVGVRVTRIVITGPVTRIVGTVVPSGGRRGVVSGRDDGGRVGVGTGVDDDAAAGVVIRRGCITPEQLGIRLGTEHEGQHADSGSFFLSASLSTGATE